MLVHGGAAHSRWWDHIAPMLTEGWRVVAVDLSGHGDSDRRDHYSLDTWAREDRWREVSRLLGDLLKKISPTHPMMAVSLAALPLKSSKFTGRFVLKLL